MHFDKMQSAYARMVSSREITYDALYTFSAGVPIDSTFRQNTRSWELAQKRTWYRPRPRTTMRKTPHRKLVAQGGVRIPELDAPVDQNLVCNCRNVS